MEIMIHEFWHVVSMMFVCDWFTKFNMMSGYGVDMKYGGIHGK